MPKKIFLVKVVTKKDAPFLQAYIEEAIKEWGDKDHPEKEYRSSNISEVVVKEITVIKNI